MGHVTSKDGTRIAYEAAGHGSPVILVDGALGHRRFMGMSSLAARLARHLRAVAYDRRGRGDSGDTQPYSVEREIDDIAALIEEVGGPVNLYGFSSGAVLALAAAAKLGESKVAKLALHEPPFNDDGAASREEFATFARRTRELLDAGAHGDAVAFFLSDMIPPDVLEEMKGTPDWKLMVDVAPTLAYDNVLMADGSVPVEPARRASMPTLVLDGDESEEFRRLAADAVAAEMPRAVRMTIGGQTTLVPPDVLAPILHGFFDHR
jgi:pimeloyl-ACP methyl ester carboxylesterase